MPLTSAQNTPTLPGSTLEKTSPQNAAARSATGAYVTFSNGATERASGNDLVVTELTTMTASSQDDGSAGDVATSNGKKPSQQSASVPGAAAMFSAVRAQPGSHVTGSWETTATEGSARQKRKEKQRAEEFRLAVSLMVVLVVFVLCWLPFCVTMLLSVFHPQGLARAADMFTLLLGYSNSCLNPVIYGLMNKRVKEGYLTLWRKIRFKPTSDSMARTSIMRADKYNTSNS